MLAEPAQEPLDVLVPDPSGHPPLCGEEECAALLESMVADNAPRVFAVVREWGERVDARIAAWGMAFEDHVDVVGGAGVVHLGAPTPDLALRCYRIGTRVGTRLVWVNSDAATPADS